MDARDNDHAHCLSCIQGPSCQQQTICPVATCVNRCGVSTHSCKMDDHVKEVCPRAQVACPNQLYGCPKVTERWKLSSHLLACPAYLISCPYRSQLSDTADQVTKGMGCRSLGPCESKCEEILRRDTFSEHMRDHSDLLSGFDGWLEARCPLAFLGCPFTFRRWRPQALGQHVEFRREVGTFVISAPTQGDADAVAVADDRPCHLLRLPPELLLRIGALLDGLSLNSLAATCRKLRAVCAMELSARGSVSRRWVAQEGGRWALDECHRWRLIRSREAIRRWTFAENGLSALHAHLKVCPFNERQEKSPDPALVMLIKAK